MQKQEDQGCDLIDTIVECGEEGTEKSEITDQDLKWMRQAQKMKLFSENTRNWATLSLTVLFIVLCGVFYFVCPVCMFAILIASAVLCPFANSLNAPLWMAIILLTLSGWSFTNGGLEIRWKSSA